MIPGAKFVPLESKNHLLMRHEPAWQSFVYEVRQFLGHEHGRSMPTASVMTCPVCSRVYADTTLNYCLDDGSPLSVTHTPRHPQVSDPNANADTQILPFPP
jgi:hypothetical protein